ncbi:MAG TPA: cell envelope integrity protein TolA [Phycisphaerae bacterium]|nr:cell envelope integrity protein TolA [Phycisphaerae bacterium]
MDTGRQFVINTIYVAGDDDVRPSRGLRGVALVTLLVSFAWLYVTWAPMYRWTQKSLMFGELHIASSMMNLQPIEPIQSTTEEKGDDKPKKPMSRAERKKMNAEKRAKIRKAQAERKARAEERRQAAKNAQVVLAAAAGGWLAVATLTGFLLTIAGCSGLSSKGRLRHIGVYLLPISVIACGIIGWYVQKKYSWYETLLPPWVKPVTIGLGMAAFGSIGFMLNRHGRGMHSLAALGVIVSALLSMAAIWVTVRWGQMPSEHVNAALYTKIFVVQSAYGWLLLLAIRFT